MQTTLKISHRRWWTRDCLHPFQTKCTQNLRTQGWSSGLPRAPYLPLFSTQQATYNPWQTTVHVSLWASYLLLHNLNTKTVLFSLPDVRFDYLSLNCRRRSCPWKESTFRCYQKISYISSYKHADEFFNKKLLSNRTNNVYKHVYMPSALETASQKRQATKCPSLCLDNTFCKTTHF